MSRVAVLSHNQPASACSSTFIPHAIAILLLQRMVAERISARVIRMFPPESVFLAARPELPPALTRPVDVQLPLGAGEIENCKFRTPQSSEWQTIHLPPTNALRSRVRLMKMVIKKEIVFRA